MCFRRFSAALMENRWEVETPGITVGLYGGGKVEGMPQVLPQVSKLVVLVAKGGHRASSARKTQKCQQQWHRAGVQKGTGQIRTACHHQSFSRKRK